MKDYIYKPKHLLKLNKKIDLQLNKQSMFKKILLFFKQNTKIPK